MRLPGGVEFFFSIYEDMSESVISVNKLSKSYRIERMGARNDGLRHLIENAVRRPFGVLRGALRDGGSSKSLFWALKDLDLEIAPGEMVGIIGRNGAGSNLDTTSGSIR